MLRRKKKNFGLQGSISLLAILSLAAIILAIPITVKLVQQRQEIRKEAAYPVSSPAGESPSPSPGCKGGNESCSGTDDCCGGLQCASLPGGKFCVSPTCDEGLERCSGNFIQECQSGVWTDIQRCDASCDPRTVSCVKTCNPGETKCVGDVLETCYDDGSGWSGRSCEYGCDSGVCLASAPTCECSDGFWSGAGCTVWQQSMPCQEVPSPSPLSSPSPAPSPSPIGPPSDQCNCAPGEECVAVPGGYTCLASTCSSGETRCSGSAVQTCQNGQWRDTEGCDGECSGGSCLRVCNPGSTTCVGGEQKTCGSTGGGWSARSCTHGCFSGQCLPSPLSPSPSPITPVIQPTVPLGGVTVGYGLPQFGSTLESPYGFDPFEPCTDPTGFSCEFDPLLALGFGTPALGIGAGLGIGLLATSPQWAPLAYVTAQTYISTSPEWVQTGVSLGLPTLELGGTALAALECNQGNQEACMAGMLGGLAYTEQAMMGAIAQQQYSAEQAYWSEQYLDALEALASAGVPVESVPGEGFVYQQPWGEQGWIVEDLSQWGSWQDRLAALEHEYGHEIGRAATDFARLTRQQVIVEEYMNYSRAASSPYASQRVRETAETTISRLDQILNWDLPLETRTSMAIQVVSGKGAKSSLLSIP